MTDVLPVKVRRSRKRPDSSVELEASVGPVSLTAAAQIMQPRGRTTKISRAVKDSRNADSSWQAEVIGLLDEVGELWFAGQWLASALSQVRIVAARVSDNSDEPRILRGPDDLEGQVTDEDATVSEDDDEARVARFVARWAGGPAGQEQILSRTGWHLGMTGETYFVATDSGGDPDEDRSAESWMAYAANEITQDQSGWKLTDGDTRLPGALVVRAWRPHPYRFRAAACATRAALPILRELRGLTMHVSAQIDSRLAGAGLLFIPQSMTFPSGQQSADLQLADGEDPFVPTLMQTMITAIKDRDSAAAVVPIVVKVPDESIGKAQLIKFGDTALDGQAKELREEAINRLSLALDLPKEVVTGLGGLNHWSAWQVDESAIKLHVAPHASVICHALTVGWLQPLLAEMGIDHPEDYLVWFDTTPLVLRPDRSEDAKELYDRATISAAALRRETGFNETDAPSDEERRRLILIRIVERAPTLAPLVLSLLNMDISDDQFEQAATTMLALAGQAPNAPGMEGPRGVGDPNGTPLPIGQSAQGMLRDARKLTPTERKEIQAKAGPGAERKTTPERSRTASAELSEAVASLDCDLDPALVEACHLAVLHALERVGKRMVTGSRKNQAELRTLQVEHPYTLHTVLPVPDHDLDKLLDGAWSCLAAGRDDHLRLEPVLDTYVRQLLSVGEPHSRAHLRAALLQARICEEA